MDNLLIRGGDKQDSTTTYASQNSSLITQNTKFTTNIGSNTLLNQFKNALCENVQQLHFLIGFFRISGFIHLHKLLQECKGYERFESIKILVGLDIDALIYELENKGLEPATQKQKFRALFVNSQKEALENEDYSQAVDDSITALISALTQGQIQIRIVREKNCHAKFYIFSSKHKSHTHHNATLYQGSLIVGSSNLTHNGLEKNYEVNLLSKDSNDIDYALKEFERLWETSVPLSIEDIHACVQNTYIDILSPKEIYYKLLLTHFGEEFLKKGDPSIAALFKNYATYDYQIEAVREGIEKLKKYNGFFLADVVGLGKTLIASVIAKKCYEDELITGATCIITPPALKQSWIKHLNDINIGKRHIYTHDTLHKMPQELKNEIELIIIDESHNFRSSTSQRYRNLELLCHIPYRNKRKKVILLSATPQNNSPADIANQVYLFLPKRHSKIEGLENLEYFLNNVKKEFKKVVDKLKSSSNKHNIQKLKKELKNIANTLRDKLLSHIMIRRTRGDIEKLYGNDMQKQHLIFPTICPPKDLTYELDSTLLNLTRQTIAFLNKEPNSFGNFTYARYLIFPNLTPEGQKRFFQEYDQNKNQESFYHHSAERLSIMIQMILFKRFDSSIEAFKSTLSKQIKAYEAYIEMFEKGEIIILKRSNYDEVEKLYDAMFADDERELEDFLSKNEDKYFTLLPSHFSHIFLEHLQSDKSALQSLLYQWQHISNNSKTDPKCEKLKSFLAEQIAQKHKIVLFTEAKVSAIYLKQSLTDYRILQIDSHNREDNEEKIRQNFDANYTKELQKDDYDILITTDTLSEGINLHRADVIINYDTPYNATRLMQRIGRINRIGTSFPQIHIYNFKPIDVADKIIKINNIAKSKLQSFHYTLGEDSAIYDEEEEISSKNLYTKVIEREQEELSKETLYKEDLKNLYQNDKEAFLRIKALPLKSRTIIQAPKCESFAYISQTLQQDKSLYPYHISPSNTLLQELQVNECSFYEMADFLKQHLETKSIAPRDLSLHYEHIYRALTYHKECIRPKPPLAHLTKLGSLESKAIAKLTQCLTLDKNLLDKLKDLILSGNTRLAQKIIDIKAQDSAELSKNILALITEQGLDTLSQAHTAPATQDAAMSDSQPYTKPQIQISITALPPHTKETK